MTLLSTIAADQDAIFLNSDSCPQYRSAVYTPVNGIAQPAVSGLFSDVPLHGDENQDYPVVQYDTSFTAKSSAVSTWRLRGKVTISSIDYELVNAPFPSSSSVLWSVCLLRLKEPTKI
jgi:hypothetical protein